jgi:hypothetical protein
MKLWVRSQERDKLEMCNSLSIQPIITSNKKHQTWGVISNFGCVGEYATRERCLEIIDEIQCLLKNNGSTEDRMSQLISGIENKFVVYEMPEQ